MINTKWFNIFDFCMMYVPVVILLIYTWPGTKLSKKIAEKSGIGEKNMRLLFKLIVMGTILASIFFLISAFLPE